MAKKLKGKVAVITGAGRGIGRAIAMAMAEEGASVVVNDLGCEVDGSGVSFVPANEVVEDIRKLGGTAVANSDTVATMEGAKQIIKTAIDKFGRIDVLVNNAGVARPGLVYKMPENDWDLVLDTHLGGTFNCTVQACSHMKNTPGRIINISSSGGIVGGWANSSYGAAKAAIAGFTKCIAREMVHHGVTTNAIVPAALTRMSSQVVGKPGARPLTTGTTLGPMLDRIEKINIAKGMELAEAGSVAEEIFSSDRIASVAVYLASDQAADVNGLIIGVAGMKVFLYSFPDPVKVIYKNGTWTLDDLDMMVPVTLADGLFSQTQSQAKDH